MVFKTETQVLFFKEKESLEIREESNSLKRFLTYSKLF